MARLSLPLVLASGSPRRKEILEALGLRFRVEASGADETVLLGEEAFGYAERVARAKALDVCARLEGEAAEPTVVLAADTIVVVDGDVLGKPRDDEEGAAMLLRMSGRTHEVATAVVLAVVGEGVRASRVVRTEVIFDRVTPTQAARYVRTGEGRDKAGGYALQGLAGGFVRSLRGSSSNVIGLPAAETLEMLSEAGLLAEWP